ncbi:ABC transporter ATP-binding protein [Pseudomonas rubra]|uniref:ABC transporter ATP-binding protein/permease n=1 Tax=Pseudomonas rubra TaxID=2942627 RepID=A0ABT5PDL1_9PSED|nr:ABC transporter ATP-binding protein [Pseudomonas rubra]MDD1016394.1 ABC transporter ATP-binding protein/permease [Pseudomonas rubra]MDD1036523.1 ABC transporter ATP-binding protein/permease [Pseudomonas rubra]MDD1156565.1 ABC transporter ATP-binding protein/permease [Pseudomonas rubra]
MLKTFIRLLGDDARVFRRYLSMAIGYGLLCGLSICTLAPVLSALLAGDTAAAAQWLVLLVLSMAVCWAMRRRLDKAGVAVGVAVLQGGRQRIGDHVARLPLGWFTPENTARLNHVVTQGMMAVAQLPAHVFTPVVSGAVTPLVLVVALFMLHWPLAVIALLALPLLAWVQVYSARLGRRADQAYQRSAAEASQRMVEFAQAQAVLRAFTGGNSTRFLQQAIDQQHAAASRLIRMSATSAVLNLWLVQAVFAALLIAALVWMEGALTQASVIAVCVALLLVNRFIEPLLEVAGYGETLRGAGVQLEAVAEILAAQPLAEPVVGQAPVDASVELTDVHFSYGAGRPEVLQGVSLRLEPGSMTALVGASGSGKTTLVRLIARFFDASAGSVRVGGVDVRQMTAEQLAAQISQIFQDTYLFQGSIADNIRLGKPGASTAQVLEAACQAGVDEIIERLPQGLWTPVGEGGARLSGGERQRIAIARALIKDSPILLVDEATAALDAQNQAAISQTLAHLRGKRTLIVIAHQLSTVVMADQVLVLDQGRIVEQGTPAQLAEAQGRYAHYLAQRQAAKGWRIAAAQPVDEQGLT